MNKKSLIDYLLLILLVIIYLVLILAFSFSKKDLNFITLGLAFFYFFWGIWHHKKEKSLHPRIVIEYLIIAALGYWLVTGIV